MKNPLISVIVPVYKVESYLERCVDSILAQTYDNIEIILVDDGSPDGCPLLCDEIAKRQSNCLVLHQKNGGQSNARNSGMNIAHGDYIGFVDSDDWVSSDMYAYLYGLIQQSKAEIAQVSFMFTEEYMNEEPPRIKEKIEVYKDKEILQYYMTTTTTTTGSYSVCRCLFAKKTLEGLCFRDGKINEDIDFKYKALSRACVFVVSNQVKYFYFQGGTSTTRGGLVQRDFDLYDAANELDKLTNNEEYGSIRFLGKVKKARTSFSLLSKIAYYGIADKSINKKETVKKLQKELRRDIFILLKSPLSLVRKILAVFLCINETIPEVIIRIIKGKGK